MATRAKKQQRRQRRKAKRQTQIQAAAQKVPADFRILDASGDFELAEIEAAEDGDNDGKPKLRKFKMRAYNGGPMRLTGFFHPVVVDLAGLKSDGAKRPILRDHNPAQIVGHSDEITNQGRRLTVAGTISGANPHAQEVAASADAGFPWNASIGATAEKMVFLDRGEKQTVNGQQITGPVFIARKAKLKEISFVAIGADDTTRARMTAAGKDTSQKGEAGKGTGGQVRKEIKRLRDAGMTVEEIGRRVDRSATTMNSIQNGEIKNPPKTLLDKLKKIPTPKPTAKATAIQKLSTEGNRAMNFDQWLEANGWDADQLSPAQLAQLEAAFGKSVV